MSVMCFAPRELVNVLHVAERTSDADFGHMADYHALNCACYNRQYTHSDSAERAREFRQPVSFYHLKALSVEAQSEPNLDTAYSVVSLMEYNLLTNGGTMFWCYWGGEENQPSRDDRDDDSDKPTVNIGRWINELRSAIGRKVAEQKRVMA